MSDAIDSLIERHGPTAICRALEPMLTPERVARIDQVLANRLTSVTVAVEDTYDPHNAAAAIRTSEALGLHELHVIEPEERFSAAKGVTRGAHRWIDLHRWPDAATAATALRARGFRVLATLPDARDSASPTNVGRAAPPNAVRSVLDVVDVSTPVAVMFGNEHDGLTQTALAACDGAVTVPMFGFTESFNLSVTVALVANALAARRRAQLGAPGDLPLELRAHLRARWFALRIRGVVGILERALG